MATLNEVIRQRRAVLLQLQQKMRAVNSAQEQVERDLRRLRARRNKVPESQDLMTLVNKTQVIDTALSAFAAALSDAAAIFNL